MLDLFLFRQPSYVVVVAPMTAALSARFLEGRRALQRTCAIAMLLLTTVAAVVWTRGSPLFEPSALPREVSRAFGQLLASPPVRGSLPLDGNPALSFEYLHDCTAPGDRLLVMDSTPFQVAYYAERPIAGGHLYWHQRWRSDPIHEARSLAMLQQQSVPFAFSTTDPVLEDFTAYPRIREYLEENYAELQGSQGRLLFDKRRKPTGTFGPGEFPCFR